MLLYVIKKYRIYVSIVIGGENKHNMPYVVKRDKNRDLALIGGENELNKPWHIVLHHNS